MEKPRVGMIGLAVMGSNLAQNIERNGFPCAVYNRTHEVTEEFMTHVKGRNFVASKSLEEFVASMQSPRQIIIMVKAGAPVDAVIDSLLPLVSKGDIIMDGGNSYFTDTQRREKKCKDAGVHFLGVGISGGEEGALNGASIMPGGPKDAWEICASLFDKISAKAPHPCTTYIGPDGAGHYVKMVHNGIEYGDMQLIAEAYDLLQNVIGCKPDELSEIFTSWNQGVLSSFLIEITAKIFKKKDTEGQGYLVDSILDAAGQKGTGKWTAQVSLDLGVAIPTLASAVDARILSSMKSERVKASNEFSGPAVSAFSGDRKQFIQAVHDALYCSKIMAYAQGMANLSAASKEHSWNLRLDEIAAIWEGGCIIRARFLEQIRAAYKRDPNLANLMLDATMKKEIAASLPNLRKVVQIAIERGLPCLSFATSVAYFDSYRTANLPQNLTQAQRDFFGAHTYQRKDKPGVFHTEW
ncbi:MAG: NADP-dependent phosphogluconate dehydrogenase [Deltaproteobacteria bacterium]|nr:NADP-dependent phosphogluconate dehydrogenase [Deltaproteobacteria bacterium]